ncbi:hypothetical protein [Mucilaginibacter sp. L3T2-6]|uniref:hypothetical protein n=1 Tax=Mucilaginibacter sp. L3T2-6 TaxID=3062491 RepID=UPI002676D7CB|nr:hypothetical protein [Mucilaginibacter sp. L3T2-6]MDO3641969.1 hypothetical protein [Mucilaginibacter sp. L3T2-6]MDV6214353.1 hypothetical protein [Mucilaginibacter sp. L3T2-6]
MLKTTKRYVINSNAVNNYGYRVLSEGIDQSQYNNNRVMLWLHYRPTGARKDEVLALGYIDDIQIDKDGVMSGQPYFDDGDTFAKSVYDKYEKGIYNMFSLCALPMEVSMEPEDMLQGQTGPTITKSLLKEISAVDIGGNPDAYGIELCDEAGKLIKLADGKFPFEIPTKPKNADMKITSIAIAPLLPLIKLSDDPTEKEVQQKLIELIQLADTNNKELIKLKDEKKISDDKVIELTAELSKVSEIKLKGLHDSAVTVDRKLTEEQWKAVVKLSDGNVEKIEAYLAAIPANPTIRELHGKNTLQLSDEVAGLMKLSYQELDQQNKLVKLKDLDINAFKAKYKERFGKDFKD